MMRNYDRKLVLEDGVEFLGFGFGSGVERVCEVVFNTSSVGYQEIVSDMQPLLMQLQLIRRIRIKRL